MGFFKKLTEAVNSVDNFANKLDEAINTAQSKMDGALNALDKKLSSDESEEEATSSYSSGGTFYVAEGITEIDEETFDDLDNETTIVLPSTLEKMDSDSFDQCKHIERIDFSKVKHLETIPDYLFDKCKQIREIVIPEGVTEIEDDVFTNCKKLRKIVLPQTLEKIGGSIEDCPALHEIVFPKDCKLEELPDYFLHGDINMSSFAIPNGIQKVGDPIWNDGKLTELYIPPTVTEIGSINQNYENDVEVYLYANEIEDIEDLSSDAKTLYVMPDAYAHYKEFIDENIDPDYNKVVLKVMPSEKMNFYGEPQPVVYQQQAKEVEAVVPPLPKSMPEMPKEKAVKEAQITQILSSVADNAAAHNEEKHAAEAPQVVKRPGQLFSDGLEELINAAVATGEVTDKKREIILRRAIKEGEDPNEVEMVLDARIYEYNNK